MKSDYERHGDVLLNTNKRALEQRRQQKEMQYRNRMLEDRLNGLEKRIAMLEQIVKEKVTDG
jgi:hypothetical protein